MLIQGMNTVLKSINSKSYFSRINAWGLGAYLTHPLEAFEHLGELLAIFLEANPHVGNGIIYDLPRRKGVVIPVYNAVSWPVIGTRSRDSGEIMPSLISQIAVFVERFFLYLEFLFKRRNILVKIDKRRTFPEGSFRPFLHVRHRRIRLAGLAW